MAGDAVAFRVPPSESLRASPSESLRVSPSESLRVEGRIRRRQESSGFLLIPPRRLLTPGRARAPKSQLGEARNFNSERAVWAGDLGRG